MTYTLFASLIMKHRLSSCSMSAAVMVKRSVVSSRKRLPCLFTMGLSANVPETFSAENVRGSLNGNIIWLPMSATAAPRSRAMTMPSPVWPFTFVVASVPEG